MEHESTEENLDNGKARFEFKNFDELATFFEQKYPESVAVSADREIELLESSARRDVAATENGVLTLLREHELSVDGVRKLDDGKWSISYKEKLREDLPPGYAFKGGAARYYLREALGLSADLPRDYDVVRLVEAEPFPGADREVAQKFMPKDLEFGDGVEQVLDMEEYFRTRDLTVNEIVATSDGIVATESALLDTVRNILRLTHFEKTSFRPDGYAGPKMLAKILRFYSQAINECGRFPTIENIGHDRIDEVFISPFWLAVNLDRAWEVGRTKAQDYVDTLISNKQLPIDVVTPEAAADYLLGCMEEESFVFRSADPWHYDTEDVWVRNLEAQEDRKISEIRKRLIKR
ncbi:MAG: hypothetical protein WCO79_03540 [bacterium]